MKNRITSILLWSILPLYLLGQNITISPNNGQQNSSFGVTVTGSATSFIASTTTCVEIYAVPATITLSGVNVASPTLLTGNINIPLSTTPGTYNATVFQGPGCAGLTYNCSNCFTVTALPGTITSVSPNNGDQGEFMQTVSFNGSNTNFTGSTDCVEILASPTTISATNITVNSSTSLDADIAIPANTTPGTYDVRVYESAGCTGDSYICNNCFTVSASTMTVMPNQGSQNTSFGVTITGSGFNFDQASQVTAQVLASPTAISVTSINVVSSSTITGTVNVPASAIIGFYDVTANDGNNFVAQTCTNCFEITVNVPVELIQFEGHLKGRDVLLSWATATESNSAYFSIEKSNNGRAWRSIGQVKAAGESQEMISYQFLDTNPVNGVNYYRLHQVDFDGTEDYSYTVAIEYKSPRQAIKLYPNPTEGNISLDMFSKANEKVSVEMIDISGRSVYSQNNLSVHQGSNLLDLSTDDLMPGLYFVKVIKEDGSFDVEQFVKL